ncbi:MAG: ABC transporter substrate-binding protein [Ruminiclostridium sp.]
MNQKYSGKTVLKNLMLLLLTVSFFTLSLSGQPAVSAASELDTSKTVELKWYVMGSYQQSDTEIIETTVNEYLEDKINATLKLNTISWGANFQNIMESIVAAGEPYDITFTANWALNYRENAAKGAFVDITNMLDIYAPKTKALLGKNILKGAQVNGKVYAIPTYNSTFAKSRGVLLNKRLAEKYKVDTSKIKKLEDLEATFKIIKAKEPKIIDFYPFDYNATYNIYEILNYEKIIDSNTPGAVKSDGKSTKVVNDFETPEAKSLFGLMNKWYNNGYINKSISSNYDYFNKNVSNIFASYSNSYPTQDQEISYNVGVDMIHVDLSKPSLNTNNITGSMQAISSTSKNPERALMFLELVNTDEVLSNLINFGIEGFHYEKIGNNMQVILDPDNNGYSPNTPFMFGNMSIAYLYPYQNPNMWSKVNENIDKAVLSPLLGFSFNSKPVSKQITKLYSITQKYYNDLCIGKINPSVTLPKMNKELKNSGLQKVLTEMQKQVDAFVKADNQ